MRIISYTIIDSYKNKIFNIHPSLLPKYTNMMDLNIHQSVIENNDIYTGCTLHIVEKDIDEGKIILQEKTKVLTTDKYELKTIVQELENKCILNCVKLIENNCSFVLTKGCPKYRAEIIPIEPAVVIHGRDFKANYVLSVKLGASLGNLLDKTFLASLP